jgi:putative spermidine/putrescine transport system permease protein
MSVAVSNPLTMPLQRFRMESLLGYALVAAPVLLLVGLVLLPAAAAIVNSVLVMSGETSRFGLDRYTAFFGDSYSRANLWFTLWLTSASALTAVMLSLGIAVYLRFSSGRCASVVQALALFPLFVPSIIISFALIRFLGPNGLLQLLLEIIGITGYRTPYLTPLGPFIGFVWESIPLPVLILTAALAQVQNHAIEAARDLGGSTFRILFEIVLPQMGRSIVIAFALVFLGTISSYTIPYLLGPAAPEMMGPFMARTYGNLQDPDMAELQAVIVLGIAALAGLLYIAATRRRRPAA